ncbi:GNAT family N-acetyltransferase [Pelomonas sp. CA6]|uniref:GNAT family N-acetyltransferase n=1 Tax=Pelomonas sp. CA6 TaxID=2907999 RepID=UPI001F4C2797|nr:GNAT family N-acetyltransferase [Pelomonas sp. CA6]MCH7345159.1 GNAT family N-acetyltransferase [Pelomonas sp. CA6]
MDRSDVPAVLAMQAQCYGADFLESEQAFAAKLQATRGLNCSYLALGADDEPLGYVVSLPVDEGQLPALDAGAWPAARAPQALYLHDLAVAPAGRAQRLGSALLSQVLRRAQDMGLPRVVLIAVQGSVPYWQRQGFAELAVPSAALQAKLDSFGAEARLMQRLLRAA